MKPELLKPLVSALLLIGATTVGVSAQELERKSPFSLLVGVRNYDPDQLKSITTAEEDINQLRETLARAGDSQGRVVVLSNSAGGEDPQRLPTKGNILRQMDSLADREFEDVVIVALRGHGLQWKGAYCFCPFDADLSDPDSLIPLDAIYQRLQRCPAERKLLLLDAMQDEPFVNRGRAKSALTASMPKLPFPPANTVVFTSCGDGETIPVASGENKPLSFFSLICKGLQGAAAGNDGSVTLPDLERFVKQQQAGQASTSGGQAKLLNNSAGLFTLLDHSLREDDIERIQDLIRRDRFVDAEQLVTSILAANPNDPKALAQRSRIMTYRAELLRRFERVDEALELADRAVRLAPNEPLPYIARANAYRLRKEYERCFGDAKKAIECDPNCVMAHVICAFAYYHLHDLAGMERAAKVGIEVDPNYPEPRASLACALFAARRWNEGVAQLERAIAMHPEMPALHFLKGYAMESQGRHEQAIEAYTEAIRCNDQVPDYLVRRAVSYAGAGNVKAAYADVAAAEQIAPDFPDVTAARVRITQILRGWGHDEDALAEGLKTNPRNADLWRARGFNHYSVGRMDRAVQSFEKALEIYPGYAEAHMGIGMVRYHQGRYDDALVHLNRATRHKPHLPRAHHEKSLVHAARGDYQAALKSAELAAKYDPSNAEYQHERDAQRRRLGGVNQIAE